MTVDSAGMSMADRVRAVVETHRGDRGALMPILHGIQAEFGYIDQAMVPVLATELNISRADVHGVVSFYTDFRSEPAGRTTVKLCRAEACQSVGAERLVEHAQQVWHTKVGQTSADGALTLDQVFCLGNCALGPAGQINGKLYGRLDETRLDAIIEAETGKA
ncbi:NAD(P)H-dependent oxidoreductase subunit E [Amycolatopsis nigrescens]|uniref:NAD(P)H-dependent oxidoreductase subunit E n=1 Tax=Amycolatopsis nigrescens TaxID=381445 RepID=UPI00035D118C|nr:NAD(P)H-dependent oxidoreductase subunit E [Amycolatopsis nigrescens]